jgi:hypothetical protein
LVLSPSLEDHVGTTKHLSNSVEWKLRYEVEWSIDVETKFFVESLSLNLSSLVKIDNLPLLVSSIVVTPNSNSLSFLVLCSSNIKDLIVGPVDELIFVELEDLEPSGVSAPDLHVVGLTSTLDVPRLIVVSSSDCQGLLVEVPDLGLSSVWCLDNKVSVVDQVKVSVRWEFSDNVEISLNVKTELLVELSLSWLLLIVFNINYSPSLMNFIVSSFHHKVSIFIVKTSRNGNDLSFFVGQETIIAISKHLPPS